MRTWISAFSALGLLTLLASCTASALNFLIPTGDLTIHKDIAYGTDPRQKLDIYVPKGGIGPRPVVLFFYGGSWQGGSKADYLFAGEAFASKGYVAVVADYRVYPQVSFPVFLEDGASALAFVHAQIGAYGGDADNIFLAGHSAGGYIAVMLAADTRYVKAVGANEHWIRGVAGIAGPYDFLPFTDPNIIALFSTAEGPQTQPVTFVHPGMPPVFLATGNEDTTVLPRNLYRLADKLRANHDSVETHVYPGVAHIGIALSLARGFRYKTPVLDDIARFIEAHRKTPAERIRR